MSHFLRRYLPLLVMGALLLSAQIASAAPSAWVVDSLTAARRTSTGAATVLTADAARNMRVHAQVLVRASTSGSASLALVSSDLVVAPFTERWVYVTKGSGTWSSNQNKGAGPGWYPWGLVPYTWGSTISLAANQTEAVWLDIYVPRGTTPGTHTVSLMAGSVPISVAVTVYNVELPTRPILKSGILLWNVRYDKTAEALLLRERLQAEYVQAPFFAEQAVASAGFWGSVTTTSVGRAIPTLAEVQKAVAGLPGIEPHSYVFDELGTPSASVLATMLQYHAALQAGGDRLLATVPPGIHWEGVVDIGVTLAFQAMWQAPVEPWFYWTCEQDDYSPKGLLDKDPINWVDLTGFLPARLGYKGVLYWAADRYSTTSPWTTSEVSMGASYPGEGILMLPGASVGRSEKVLPTIPLELLGEGAAQFDLYTMAVRAGQKATADAYTAQVGTAWTAWTRDHPKVYGAQRSLLKLLDSLATPAPTPTWTVSLSRTGTASVVVQAATAEAAKALAITASATWAEGSPVATGATQNP